MGTHPKDLRYFLQILDERWPGEVLRVDTAGKEFVQLTNQRSHPCSKLKPISKTSPRGN